MRDRSKPPTAIRLRVHNWSKILKDFRRLCMTMTGVRSDCCFIAFEAAKGKTNSAFWRSLYQMLGMVLRVFNTETNSIGYGIHAFQLHVRKMTSAFTIWNKQQVRIHKCLLFNAQFTTCHTKHPFYSRAPSLPICPSLGLDSFVVPPCTFLRISRTRYTYTVHLQYIEKWEQGFVLYLFRSRYWGRRPLQWTKWDWNGILLDNVRFCTAFVIRKESDTILFCSAIVCVLTLTTVLGSITPEWFINKKKQNPSDSKGRNFRGSRASKKGLLKPQILVTRPSASCVCIWV